MRRTSTDEIVLGAPQVGSALVAWRDVWQAREIVRAFAVRSLRIRYRQAVLGALWAVAQPLALLVPFLVFFDPPGTNGSRAAATLAALVGWQYLSGAVTTGAGALVSEAFLVRKTWFPREAPVVAAVMAAGMDLLLGLALFAVAGPFLGARVGWGLLAMPLLVGALVVIALALALPLAALNAQFRDVRHALPFLVLLWLFISPVAYPLGRWSPGRRLIFAFANPAAGPLEGFRLVLAEGRWPDFGLLAASLATALVLGAVGHRRFRRMAPNLPDVI